MKGDVAERSDESAFPGLLNIIFLMNTEFTLRIENKTADTLRYLREKCQFEVILHIFARYK